MKPPVSKSVPEEERSVQQSYRRAVEVYGETGTSLSSQEILRILTLGVFWGQIESIFGFSISFHIMMRTGRMLWSSASFFHVLVSPIQEVICLLPPPQRTPPPPRLQSPSQPLAAAGPALPLAVVKWWAAAVLSCLSHVVRWRTVVVRPQRRRSGPARGRKGSRTRCCGRRRCE